MERAAAVVLIAEEPGVHGVFDPPTEKTNELPCTFRSVGMNETYAAKSAKLEPSIVFTRALAEDYAGEKIVELAGVRYRVIRTWLRDDGGIDITCESVTNDRKAVTT